MLDVRCWMLLKVVKPKALRERLLKVWAKWCPAFAQKFWLARELRPDPAALPE